MSAHTKVVFKWELIRIKPVLSILIGMKILFFRGTHKSGVRLFSMNEKIKFSENQIKIRSSKRVLVLLSLAGAILIIAGFPPLHHGAVIKAGDFITIQVPTK